MNTLIKDDSLINELLREIDEYSRGVNIYEYGLPIFEAAHKSSLCHIVLKWLRKFEDANQIVAKPLVWTQIRPNKWSGNLGNWIYGIEVLTIDGSDKFKVFASKQLFNSLDDAKKWCQQQLNKHVQSIATVEVKKQQPCSTTQKSKRWRLDNQSIC